jgi:phosphoenolpyruvate carboxykinase (GTP)
VVGRIDPTPPEHLIDWHGEDWTPRKGTPSSNPNARFTAPATQCPVIAAEWEDPAGVPIDGILFGGRRNSAVPLVAEAYDWEHGVFMGATIASEMTAAQEGSLGTLRRDPFAMLPFCGYHMGDYFGHWLDIGAKADAATLPRIYTVNWFRRDADGRFLWPGFGENARVLKWVFERAERAVEARNTAAGRLPHPRDLDLEGMELSDDDLAELLSVDPTVWRMEADSIRDHLAAFGDRLPPALWAQLDRLETRLDRPA